MIVSNSTPLIHLTKLGHLQLLRELFGEVNAPSHVIKEVLHGKEFGFQDAGIVEKAKQDGWVREVELTRAQEGEILQLKKTFTDISRADAAAIVLARDVGTTVCLDDSRAVKVAEVMGVGHVGTMGVILLAIKKGHIDKKEARELALALPENGFYLTHDLLALFLGKLEQI